mmetsp:Transcript_37768/g.88963  ORF Transcript_37768/g.88963 Transcript_37768/m.88963 type:complete len:301 (-) Transcript_37768:856-1758(-)
MPAPARCCTYKTARRSLIIVNLIDFVFCIVFIGVGSVSLIYAQSFAKDTANYCIEQCARTNDAESVGCNCDNSPATTTIPSLVFQSPSIGLIVVGVFSFFKVMLGCFAAIREKGSLIIAYICFLVVTILLIFGFGAAAAAVSTANTADIEGPIFGVLNSGDPPNYKLFDWKSLDSFFPEACYAGVYVDIDPLDESKTEHVYNHPLCTFNGGCVRYDATPQEEACCNKDMECLNKDECISGSACLGKFFNKVGAPVAVAAFLSLIIQFMALGYACAIRQGPGGDGPASMQAKNEIPMSLRE